MGNTAKGAVFGAAIVLMGIVIGVAIGYFLFKEPVEVVTYGSFTRTSTSDNMVAPGTSENMIGTGGD